MVHDVTICQLIGIRHNKRERKRERESSVQQTTEKEMNERKKIRDRNQISEIEVVKRQSKENKQLVK